MSSFVLVGTGLVLFYLQRQSRGKQEELLKQAEGLMQRKKDILQAKSYRSGGGIMGAQNFGNRGGFGGARTMGSGIRSMAMGSSALSGAGLSSFNSVNRSGQMAYGNSALSNQHGKNRSAAPIDSSGVAGTISMVQRGRDRPRRIYTGRRRRRRRQKAASDNGSAE